MEKTIYEAQVQVVEPRWEIESGFEETREKWLDHDEERREKIWYGI